MKQAIAITDLTRMYEGRVCVAGYNAHGECIRPVLPPPGIHESTLYVHGKPVIYPFALVEYDLLRHLPQPPHTEDKLFNPDSVRFVEKLENDRKRDILANTQFGSVQNIFEVPIKTGPGFYIQNCQGVRSLGTIRPARVLKAIYNQDNTGRWHYRLGFMDGEEKSYWLTITDLTWRYYCDQQCNSGVDPKLLSSDLTSKLRIRETFLRIGLARGWEKFPDRCYLQITGVYTFPDYLDGKTFADFATEPGDGLS